MIRTRRAFFKSAPGRYLLVATSAIIAATLLLPYTPLAGVLGFQPLPGFLLLVLAAIAVTYVLAAEMAKENVVRS